MPIRYIVNPGRRRRKNPKAKLARARGPRGWTHYTSHVTRPNPYKPSMTDTGRAKKKPYRHGMIGSKAGMGIVTVTKPAKKKSKPARSVKGAGKTKAHKSSKSQKPAKKGKKPSMAKRKYRRTSAHRKAHHAKVRKTARKLRKHYKRMGVKLSKAAIHKRASKMAWGALEAGRKRRKRKKTRRTSTSAPKKRKRKSTVGRKRKSSSRSAAARRGWQTRRAKAGRRTRKHRSAARRSRRSRPRRVTARRVAVLTRALAGIRKRVRRRAPGHGAAGRALRYASRSRRFRKRYGSNVRVNPSISGIIGLVKQAAPVVGGFYLSKVLTGVLIGKDAVAAPATAAPTSGILPDVVGNTLGKAGAGVVALGVAVLIGMFGRKIPVLGKYSSQLALGAGVAAIDGLARGFLPDSMKQSIGLSDYVTTNDYVQTSDYMAELGQMQELGTLEGPIPGAASSALVPAVASQAPVQRWAPSPLDSLYQGSFGGGRLGCGQ